MDPRFRPTVTTQSDLEAVWRHVVGPLAFDDRSLWLMQVDPDRQVVPAVLEVAECDDLPDPEMAARFADLLLTLDGEHPGGSFAFLLSRPGHGISAADRAWALFVHEAGRAAGVRLEMVHLATYDGTAPLPPDELMERRSA